MSINPVAPIRAEVVEGIRCVILYLYGGNETMREQFLKDLDLAYEIEDVIFIGALAFGDSRHSTEADGSYFIRSRGSASAALVGIRQRLVELLTTKGVTVRSPQSVS